MSGTTLPRLGLGTYGLTGEAGITAVVSGLQCGYRMLDTAVSYGNEREVGEGLRRSGVPREDVFVQTKIPGRMHAQARTSVVESLGRLGLEYLDSVLIHWPNPRRGLYVQAWEGLVAAQQDGLVRQVGVSNFLAEHLDEVIAATGVTPAYNQIEVHPYFPQAEARADHERRGILTQAWSPLGKGTRLLLEPPVTRVAQRVGATPAQVVLAWHLNRGCLPVPKSASPARQAENLAALDLELGADELAEIDTLARPDGRRRSDLEPLGHEEW